MLRLAIVPLNVMDGSPVPVPEVNVSPETELRVSAPFETDSVTVSGPASLSATLIPEIVRLVFSTAV